MTSKTIDRGTEFSEIAYQVLVLGEHYDIARVAGDMGMSYDVLYARIRNRTPFSADEIRALLRAAPDPRFVSYLLAHSPFVAAERIEARLDDTEEGFYRAANRIVIEATDVLRAVNDALLDHKLDHRDLHQIHSEIAEAERALVSLRKHIQELSED